MPQQTLHAPWRMDYIRTLDKPSGDGCFLCDAAATADDEAERARRLLLWATPHMLVIMNRFPYTNGHLLVAPRRHIPEIDSLTEDEAHDLTRQTLACVRLLKKAMNPQGFNIGMNLGRCAGAGLPGHIHQHVVPRWSGDVNFISVVGEIRIQPQAMAQLYEELVAASK